VYLEEFNNLGSYSCIYNYIFDCCDAQHVFAVTDRRARVHVSCSPTLHLTVHTEMSGFLFPYSVWDGIFF